MAKVLLVLPTNRQVLQTHRGGVGHLGLAYIAAYLIRHGHEAKICDMKLQPTTEVGFRRLVADFRPDIVGVTSMTHEIFAAADCCRQAKDELPETLTVVGGAHPTALVGRTLEEFGEFDVAVKGEGEETILELLNRKLTGRGFEDVRGIAYRDSGQVRINPDRPWISDLDALPFPAWSLVPGAAWPVFAGRGCPFGCTFCQRALGRQVRMRSVDNVLAEFDAMEEQLGYRGTWFQDETFCISRKWAEEFLEKLVDRNQRTGYVWSWKANSRVNLADPVLYGKMKEAGCRCLDFGVESGDDEVLKRVRKSITRESARKAIRTAKSAGLETNAFFIIGHPGETLKTALRTVGFAASCGAGDIAVGVMVPYPGTQVWEYARKGDYNYKLMSEDWRDYDKYFGDALSIKGLSRRRLELLQSLAYVWFNLRNLRVIPLARFLSKFKKEAWYTIKRLLNVAGTPSKQHSPA